MKFLIILRTLVFLFEIRTPDETPHSPEELLSIHRISYGSIFGAIIVDKASRHIHYKIFTPLYRGNLIGGSISGEVPQEIVKHMNKIRNNAQLQLYLSLYTDILREEKIDFIYFRCWNLLEIIARSKNFIGQPLIDLQGNPILNRHGQPRIIEDKAEDLVTELIRTVYVANNSNYSLLSNVIQNGEIKIWYRHRNCVAHQGGCFPNDSNFCDRTDPKFVNCKQAYDGIVAISGSYDSFNDSYLRNLKEIVKIVIYNELK